MSAYGLKEKHPASQRLIVLDFDGVLLDTERIALETWTVVLDEAGIDLPDGIPTHPDGTLARDALNGALTSLLGQERARASWDVFEHENQRRADREPLAPATRSFLDHCRAGGHRLAVASGNAHSWVAGHLDRLGIRSHFASVSCAGRGLAPKPAPDVYLAALRHAGHTSHRALAVDDSFAGLRSAHTAGIPVAWFTARPAAARPPVPLAHRIQALDELNSIL
ncbi:HAD family hydrolase [Streptomyces venezuelae]